jgi:hypothetical protein
LDHPLIAERYFFPRPDAPSKITPVKVDGAELACYAHRPFADGRTVVHYHGNGETVADYLPWFPRHMEERGLNTFLVEYRGYGASTGVPLYGRMLDDADPIFDAVGGRADRLIVFGRSVGSTYAIELASRHPDIFGLIIESGIADPLERLKIRFAPGELGNDDDALEREAAERLDHRAKLSGLLGRMLVMHAADDSLLDVSHGRRLAGWGPAGRTELVVFPRGDHNAIMTVNAQAYWAAVDRFLA